MYTKNSVSLIAFVGKDAEVRTTANNSNYTILSVATKRSWKDRESGDYVSETQWHRCIAFGRAGEYATDLKKGAYVQIEGYLRTREYTEKLPGKKGGEVKKTITEIHVTSVAKLDRGGKPESTDDPEAAA